MCFVVNRGNVSLLVEENWKLNAILTYMRAITLPGGVLSSDPLRRAFDDKETNLDYGALAGLTNKHG